MIICDEKAHCRTGSIRVLSEPGVRCGQPIKISHTLPATTVMDIGDVVSARYFASTLETTAAPGTGAMVGRQLSQLYKYFIV
ncbi:MAG: hypothetical protein WCO00_15220 [Rhodospirillaceae bacterium]